MKLGLSRGGRLADESMILQARRLVASVTCSLSGSADKLCPFSSALTVSREEDILYNTDTSEQDVEEHYEHA